MTPSDGFVLVRLQGAMQSWGIHTRGRNKAHRTTHTHPTKSGVIGMVANALGRDFSDPIDDLAALRFGVRTDVAGRLEVDYHTAGSGAFPLLPGEYQGNARWRARAHAGRVTLRDNEYVAPTDITYDPASASLIANVGNTVITQDWYLSDASFLAALSGPVPLVEGIADALARPRRPIYLGRRAYLPSHPVLAGTGIGSDLHAALSATPRAPGSPPGPLRAWIEPEADSDDTATDAVPVSDQPVSFNGPATRAARLELVITVDPPDGAGSAPNWVAT